MASEPPREFSPSSCHTLGQLHSNGLGRNFAASICTSNCARAAQVSGRGVAFASKDAASGTLQRGSVSPRAYLDALRLII